VKEFQKNMFNLAEEDIDVIFNDSFKVIQSKKGYRYNIDSFILADFFKGECFQSIIDLGCGCGIISFLLSKLYPGKIRGIELQQYLVDIAKRTIALNGIDDRVSIECIDIRQVRRFFPPSSFDGVISNPPFYPVGKGRLNPNSKKALSRHELTLTMSELLDSAAYLLKPGGTLALIYPVSRYEELLSLFAGKGFSQNRIRLVKTHTSAPPRVFLVSLTKTSNIRPVTLSPFVMYGDAGEHSQEMSDILKLFL